MNLTAGGEITIVGRSGRSRKGRDRGANSDRARAGVVGPEPKKMPSWKNTQQCVCRCESAQTRSGCNCWPSGLVGLSSAFCSERQRSLVTAALVHSTRPTMQLIITLSMDRLLQSQPVAKGQRSAVWHLPTELGSVVKRTLHRLISLVHL
jgi:hypothetical protein